MTLFDKLGSLVGILIIWGLSSYYYTQLAGGSNIHLIGAFLLIPIAFAITAGLWRASKSKPLLHWFKGFCLMALCFLSPIIFNGISKLLSSLGFQLASAITFELRYWVLLLSLPAITFLYWKDSREPDWLEKIRARAHLHPPTRKEKSLLPKHELN